MTDLWNYLQQADKPIVMYGMGNGADKILAALSRYGITIGDFFASDGFVRGHEFHGRRVLSYREICEKYDDFIVLLSFASSRAEVIDNIKRIASEHELYAPDVPVAGGGLFHAEYYQMHKEEFARARALLADEHSREVFDRVIEYKLTGRIDPLCISECDPNEVWQSILHPQDYRIACDLGAYTGDTARELIAHAPAIERIYALEPDRRNFKKLAAYAEREVRVRALNIGAWDRTQELGFGGQGNRNSSVGGTDSARFDALDHLVTERVDYIKYDVEGSEREAILGAQSIIRRDKPEMLVSLYHRNEDLFSLPLLVHGLHPDYRFYLRRFPYIPAWDLNLYCI